MFLFCFVFKWWASLNLRPLLNHHPCTSGPLSIIRITNGLILQLSNSPLEMLARNTCIPVHKDMCAMCSPHCDLSQQKVGNAPKMSMEGGIIK
jgi:hypothetical protein